jgi:hypothetical protein
MNDTNATTKTPATSTLIVEYLTAKGRKARKAGTASTEEIANAIGKPLKYTYDRLYWLAKREGRLVMAGSGKSAVWRTPIKARKAKDAAVEAPSAE